MRAYCTCSLNFTTSMGEATVLDMNADVPPNENSKRKLCDLF
jgi:hypothetical protein